MAHTLFFISRFISVLILLISFIEAISVGFTYRDLLFVSSVLIFWAVSLLYEYKRKIFSVGYLFYFIVLFLSHLWAPYRYIKDSYIHSLSETKPDDHFDIYAGVFILTSLLMFIYLLSRDKSNILKFEVGIVDYKSIKQIFYTLLLFLPLWLGVDSEISRFSLVFFTTYFIVIFWSFSTLRKQKVVLAGFVISIIVIILMSTWRFILLKYLFPILLFSILKTSFPYYKKINLRYIGLFLAGIMSIVLYGIVSEINKLPKNHGFLPDVILTFSSLDMIAYWTDRQLYRIITIWTLLGGNIIEYVNAHGFMYGLTYIKPLAFFFGFPYISLPLISAEIINASYAQPGIVAEGYANWGAIGAVINCFIIFIIAEFLLDYYLRKRSMFSLLLMLVTFSQVMLDGGTINSILYMSFLGFLSFYGLNILKRII